jgi:hypothetical protein
MPKPPTLPPATPIVLRWKNGTTTHSDTRLGDTVSRITRDAVDGHRGVFAPTGDVTASDREIWSEV